MTVCPAELPVTIIKYLPTRVSKPFPMSPFISTIFVPAVTICSTMSLLFTPLLCTVGARVAVQFMPFVTTAFYFIFVLFYYAETQKQASLQRERDMLDTQFRQAQTEFASLRQMQQNAAAYRHDFIRACLYQKNRGMVLVQRVWFIS